VKGAGKKETPPSAASGILSPTVRRVLPAAITALAVTFIAVRFVSGARDTLARTRDGACVALQAGSAARGPAQGRWHSGLSAARTRSGKMDVLKQQLGHPCSQLLGDLVPALRRRGAGARRISRAGSRAPACGMLAVSVDDDWDKIRRFFAKGSDIGRAARRLARRAEEVRHGEISRDVP
jgi:hypothetical protein